MSLEFRKLLKGIGLAVVIVSLIVTVSLAIFLVSNWDGISQLTRVISLIQTQALKTIGPAEIAEGAAKGVVESLNDPYSVYLPQEEFHYLEKSISGTYGGVGLLIGLDEEKRLVVVSPFRGTPADRAGILSGDLIVKIEDQETAGMALDTAARLMQGEPGTRVAITVVREGEAPRLMNITREVIQVPSVSGKMVPGHPGTAYINISMFNDHTARELKATVDSLKAEGMRSVVLDLRNNPGGSLQAAVDVASFFVPKGPVVHIVSRSNTDTLETTGNYLDLPVAVLVNKGSASASEIVAGAIKDRQAGVIVGEQTFGKGLVQTVFRLNGGSGLKLTTAKYLTPDNRDINKVGVSPDYSVNLDPKLLGEVLAKAPDIERDLQLNRALESLKGSQGRQ